jgi:hypothetical protein
MHADVPWQTSKYKTASERSDSTLSSRHDFPKVYSASSLAGEYILPYHCGD